LTKFFGLRLAKKNKPCYLDANFLIGYFVPGHKYHFGARRLMFSFLKEKRALLISCLALDETFYKTKVAMETLAPNKNRRSFTEFAPLFSQVLDELDKIPRITIIQFRKKLKVSIRDVLFNIQAYNLKPRDAFHFAHMKDYSTNRIATNDQDFTKRIPGIEVISY